ncbi:hypothetical protein [Streptomyces wuyuanensis]|uniref:Transcription initiation factor TFIID subunit 15 n=1 Tax=Streptomyces wuyuanensis TaxID=1196353 RepID=A0A1G9Q4R0_9ACTN|nr:hypothetical protein [Streptomyces wuyuanensis]SDM06000.1 transcription initiation factor TFIID subunit 15 [Streptomyces wuyuanensis]
MRARTSRAFRLFAGLIAALALSLGGAGVANAASSYSGDCWDDGYHYDYCDYGHGGYDDYGDHGWGGDHDNGRGDNGRGGNGDHGGDRGGGGGDRGGGGGRH